MTSSDGIGFDGRCCCCYIGGLHDRDFKPAVY
jgi:hypothetical protein